ncbi:MAG: DNA adenine methylase [Proteobacteria bacterium]|jgi:DNA adenine methylase|nr:DNA adenine methylase [Pseudomonadota bacterium]
MNTTERRINFLKSITNQKYKRVVNSPIRYAGGKSLGVGHVLELVPEGVERVVSPFFGGGSVEIAMSKDVGVEVIGYDIFDILVNYWKYQIEQPEAMYQELKKLKPDQKTYDEVKDRLEDHWDKTTKNFESWSKACHRFKRYKSLAEENMQKEWDRKQKLEGIDLAVHYFFNFNLSYGPGFLGWSGKIYLNEKKYTSMLKMVQEFSPGKLRVECADFADVFKKHPNDFFYCDPPYYIGEDSKMFKGIYPMRNIPIHHEGFKHDLLAECLKNHKGGFVLSYNDCPKIRELYKGYDSSCPVWQYTMGQGETRMGKNRIERGDADFVKESHEIIFYCPPPKSS